LNNFELASVLQFLDIATVGLVCKYWYDICHCEYVEGREAPDTDYVSVPLLSSLPSLPAQTRLTYDLSSTHHSMPTEIVVPSAATATAGAAAKSEETSPPKQTRSKVEELPSAEVKEEPGAAENISSLSDDNHIGRSGAVLKKQSEIEKYLEEVEQKANGDGEQGQQQEEEGEGSKETMRRNLLAIQQMESEKTEVKEKIFQWKRHFEKKYRRPPSDEEKVRNIPGLFQRYSIVSPPTHTPLFLLVPFSHLSLRELS
jgi:hypothetical protein